MPLRRSIGVVLRETGKVVRFVTDPKTIAVATAAYVGLRALAQPTTRVLKTRVTSGISYNVPKPLPTKPVYGTEYSGRPLRLMVMGDSLAAGATAIDPDLRERPEAVLPAAMAEQLAHRLKRPVELIAVAEVGNKHQDLDNQLHWAVTDIQSREGEGHVAPKVDLAVIIAGSNDVRDGNYEPIDLVSSSLRNCVTKLHDKFGKPAILVVECPLLTTAPATDNQLVRLSMNPRALGIRAVQRQVVGDSQGYENDQVRVELVEVDDITAGLRAEDGAFVSYDIHPTGPGQRSFVKQLVDGKLGEMADSIRTFSGTQRPSVALRARRARQQRGGAPQDRNTGTGPHRLAGGGVVQRVAGRPPRSTKASQPGAGKTR